MLIRSRTMHRFLAIVAFLAVSFALARQAAAQQRWTNDAGKTITARFLRLEGDNVVLRLADGREVPHPLAKLSAASRQQARFDELRAAAKQAGLNPYYVYMDWNPPADWTEQSPKGFDAVSHYARGTESLATFAQLVRETEDHYWKPAVEAQVPYIHPTGHHWLEQGTAQRQQRGLGSGRSLPEANGVSAHAAGGRDRRASAERPRLREREPQDL
jgi:hypothetical protein